MTTIVIIGGCLIGFPIVYHLEKAGVQVAVIERNEIAAAKIWPQRAHV
jgi:glycine/D-amino acid oxidase-like deaminating enzyme